MTDLHTQRRFAAAYDEARRFQNVRHLETRLRLELEDDGTESGIYGSQIQWRTIVVGVRIDNPAIVKPERAHLTGSADARTWRVSLAVDGMPVMLAPQLAQSPFYLFNAPVVLRAGVMAEIKINAWKKSTRVSLVCEMDAAPELGKSR